MVVEPPMEAAFFKILLTEWTHNKIRSRLKSKPPKALAVSDTKGKDVLGYEFSWICCGIFY